MVGIFLLSQALVILLYSCLILIEEIALLLLVSLESVEFGFAVEGESPGFDRVRGLERRRG